MGQFSGTKRTVTLGSHEGDPDGVTKAVDSDWEIVNNGMDQVKVFIDEKLDERLELAGKRLTPTKGREGKPFKAGWKMREYRGPKLKGIQVRYKECWQENGSMKFSYFLIAMQPHTLLEEKVKLANGYDIISMLHIVSNEISSNLFPITFNELIHARIHSLEIAFDFKGISNSDMNRYPYRLNSYDIERVVFEDKLVYYYRIGTGSSSVVTYKKNTINITHNLKLIGYNVFRLEFRYYCRSINRLLELPNAEDRNIKSYLSHKNLNKSIFRTIKWRMSIFPKVYLVSEGWVIIEILWRKPKHRERLLKALPLLREDVIENKLLKKEYNILRNWLKKAGMIVSSKSQIPTRISGLYEALTGSLDEIQCLNNEAAESL